MDNMGISTEPSFLEVELPQTLLESPSTSTFLPDEEASICPLLHSNNSALGPVLLSHPLSPNIITSELTSSNISNTDCKADTSSSGSSDGIAMDALDSTSTNLFNKVNYHHLQNNNMNTNQASNNHFLNGNRRQSKETPNFVSWNWPIIRKCTFFIFISGILAMCSIVIANIASMPTVCNPKSSWHRGSVFYEVNPATFIDSDNDNIGDIAGIINGIEYFANLDISGLRLNSIFPTAPTHDRHMNASITTIRPELGSLSSIRNLANILYSHNISLLLDLPLQHVIAGKSEGEVQGLVAESLMHWIDQGVNGFYLKGLESFRNNAALAKCLASWKRIVGKNRVIIIEESVLRGRTKPEYNLILEHVDLLDIILNIEHNSQQMKERIQQVLNEMPIGEDVTWVQWSIGQSSSNLERIFPATIMELMLPGTPNIMHTNELAIAQHNKNNLTDQIIQLWAEDSYNFTDQQLDKKSWNSVKMVHRMISLRERSPAIYKNFICKTNINQANTQIFAHSSADILMVVRNYPRKNSLVSITNFGSTKVTLDLTSKFYSGIRMLITETEEKIFFERLTVDAYDTIVVKLDK